MSRPPAYLGKVCQWMHSKACELQGLGLQGSCDTWRCVVYACTYWIGFWAGLGCKAFSLQGFGLQDLGCRVVVLRGLQGCADLGSKLRAPVAAEPLSVGNIFRANQDNQAQRSPRLRT